MKEKKITALQRIREYKGLSRRELAEISGVNYRSLQDYEQGHKPVSGARGETLYRLSLALGCDMAELLDMPYVQKEQSQRIQAYYENMMQKNPVWKNSCFREKQTYAGPQSKEIQSGATSEKVYYLMHGNDVVTTVTFDEITGSMLSVDKHSGQEILPFGGKRSETDLKKWWQRRAVPLYQGNTQLILRENSIATPQNYLLKNLGLSLSDHYWINPVDKCYRWEEVSLFSNDFRDEVGGFRFSDSISADNMKIDLDRRSFFYPSASLQGELQKKWVLQNGKRYLIKANYGNTCQQSINEVIASLLHEKQGKMPYTKYKLCDIEISGEKSIGCVCEDFCTEDVEFIPADELLESEKKSNDRSEYEQFIYLCDAYGLSADQVRAFLEYQILCDFALTNTDRHFYNFGVLRNVHTLEFVGMAPVFDSGNSMFWNRRAIPRGEGLLDIPVNSFKKKEVQLLSYVKDFRRVSIGDLPSAEEICSLLLLDRSCADRAQEIVQAYQEKIDLLEKVQGGAKIWKYGYRPE